MLVFVEGGKLKNPEKNTEQGENQEQTQTPGWNQMHRTLVGGKSSQHFAIPASLA